MPGEIGEILTSWSVRGAVAFYVGRVVVDLSGTGFKSRASGGKGVGVGSISEERSPPAPLPKGEGSIKTTCGRVDADRDRVARWLWTAGFALYVLHVTAAFHFYHGWSHGTALADTARQTRELFGLDWGGGLYVNYAFSLVWLADVALWWRRGADYLRDRRCYWAVQAIFAFMVLNATVVFGPAFWRWLALVVFPFLAYLGWRSSRGKN